MTPQHRFAWRAPGADERGTLMGQPSVCYQDGNDGKGSLIPW